MKIAVLSDIHGNYEALRAVYEDLQKEEAKKIINLGDFINYGPQSEEVVAFVKDHFDVSILGNHENAILHEETLSNFQVHSKLSFMITKDQLSGRSIRFIKKLKYFYCENECYYVHGIPPKNCQDYIFRLSESEIREIFLTFEQRLFFVGHTHVQGLYFFEKQNLVVQKMIPDHKQYLSSNKKFFINVGSVGQPRGHDKDAHYVIYDDSNHYIKMNTVKYNVEKTLRLLEEKNYPHINGEILKNY
ncbi:MAG: metallophosphoesterase family protein [Candidatus Marinimicrobia bacterium]|nr:metallophosphoesterase family protein [Candidatus Neomarinimicrobiota bacterium]